MEKTKVRSEGWTTANEITFINHLGTGKWARRSHAVRSRTRGELLLLYLAGAKKRENWGGVDGEEVLRHVEACIHTEKVL